MAHLSLDDAKKIFFEMDCSTFTMARKNVIEYEKYLSANVAPQQENIWREEKLEEYLRTLENDIRNEDIWKIFNRIAKITTNTKTRKSLEIINEVLNIIIGKLSIKDSVIVAEALIGRKHISQKSGLIFLAYNLGYHELAKLFSSSVVKLLDVQTDDKDLLERVNRAKEVYNIISLELEF